MFIAIFYTVFGALGTVVLIQATGKDVEISPVLATISTFISFLFLWWIVATLGWIPWTLILLGWYILSGFYVIGQAGFRGKVYYWPGMVWLNIATTAVTLFYLWRAAIG